MQQPPQSVHERPDAPGIPPAAPAATKPCPFCGEAILAVAIKCRHCASELVALPAAATVAREETLGWLLVATPLLATVLIWGWIGQMNLLQNPASSLSLVGFGTIVGTAILAAIEASRFGMGSATDLTPRGRRREGPVAWFVALLLLWIVCYPFYLARRAVYGAKNQLALGLIGGFLFVCSWAVMAQSIDNQARQVRRNLDDIQQRFDSLR